MARTFLLALLLPLAACTSLPAHHAQPSPCDAGENSYACQVERYHNISG